MAGKQAQRYPVEIIRQTINKLEDGASLTAVAKDLGVAKSTVSYWWNHASKFMGKGFEKSLNPKIAHIQTQILEYGWRLCLKAIRKLNDKIDEATYKDLIYGASELQDKLMQLKPLNGSHKVSSTQVEVSEERKITVRRFLEKQKSRLKKVKPKDGKDTAKTGLAEPGPGQGLSSPDDQTGVEEEEP